MNSKHEKIDINVENRNKNKKSKKVARKKRKTLKIILLAIITIIVIIASYITYRTIKNGGGLQGFLSTMVGHNEDTRKNLLPIDFLLLGESGGLSDTIIACSYNPNTQKASMLSIPRDTFIGKNENKATASDKVNSIYNRTRDPQKTVDAVNTLTGLDLQYYILVDAKALQQLVDTIGGVEFDVPIDMNYEDTSEDNYLLIHLQKGVQKISGEQSEQLLRFRHNEDGTTYPAEYGEQDIGRMRTQREFITAALKQTLKPGNIFKIGNFIDIMHQNLKTNLPLSVIKDYIPYAVEFSTDNLQTGTLPGESKKPAATWVYIQDKSKSEIIVNNLFFGGVSDNISETETNGNTINTDANTKIPTVQILNGSSDLSNLKKVVDKIKNLGYNVVRVGNTSSIAKTTIINRTHQEEEKENNIKNVLGCGIIQDGKTSEKLDFTINIGKDYK